MAEVNASFQKLAHAVLGQRHDLLRLFRRRPVSPALAGRTPDGQMAKVRV
jgi:hypothetical protein